MSRKTFMLSVLILVIVGWFGLPRLRQWYLQSRNVQETDFLEWVPLTYLASTGDIAVITGSFGGFTEDDRFRIITTKHVATTEGTYADTQTQIAVFGPDSSVQSAAGETLSFSTLVKLTNGNQVSVLVRSLLKDRPVVNAYVVIIP